MISVRTIFRLLVISLKFDSGTIPRLLLLNGSLAITAFDLPQSNSVQTKKGNKELLNH